MFHFRFIIRCYPLNNFTTETIVEPITNHSISCPDKESHFAKISQNFNPITHQWERLCSRSFAVNKTRALHGVHWQVTVNEFLSTFIGAYQHQQAAARIITHHTTMCHHAASPIPRRIIPSHESQHPSRQSILGTKRCRVRASSLPQDRNDTKSKQTRFVSFSEVVETMGESNTTEDAVPKIWYGRKELEIFKNQVRDYVLGRSSEVDMEKRGYERYNVVTARKKAMTRKVTLLACSQKCLSPDDVAVIVHRSTKWAVIDAFRIGCQDFCQVYHPELVDACSMIGKRSRNIDDEGTQERSSRRRTVAC
jgi:hypothetical protein